MLVPVSQEPFFNFIYNDDERMKVGWSPIGNKNAGDGYKFIGRGIIQITGRDNYKNFSDWLNQNTSFNLDLLQNPELLNSNKEIGALASLCFFKNNVIDKLPNVINNETKSIDVTAKINVAKLEKHQRKKNFLKSQEEIECL